MEKAIASAGSDSFIKVDWRLITILVTMLIAGLSFAGASVMNYASIVARLNYLEEEAKASSNHNARLVALEKSDAQQDARLAKQEARLETAIDTFQGIHRDVFTTVSKISQKLDDLKDFQTHGR